MTRLPNGRSLPYKLPGRDILTQPRQETYEASYFFDVSALATQMAFAAASPADHKSDRWSSEKANTWYASQPWLVGANYIPSDAINQFEMFQAATFNADIHDRELGLGENIGMNTMRVFRQDKLWEQDPEGRILGST